MLPPVYAEITVHRLHDLFTFEDVFLVSKRSQEMDHSETSVNLLDLPFEILCHIFSYLSQDDIFWNVGFTCQTLLRACLDNVQFIQVS